MEGMPPGEPRPPAPGPPVRPARRRILLAIVVAALVVAAGASLYLLTRPPPIPLTLSDGSSSHVLQATFADFGSPCPFSRVYEATTLANESGGATSTLSLRLFAGGYMRGDLLHLDLFPVVSGSFAPDLHPAQVTVAFNYTAAPTASAFGWPYHAAFNNSFPPFPVAFPAPTNVSVGSANLPYVPTNGSSSLSMALLNTSVGGPRYEFLVALSIMMGDPLGDNAVFGVRATVTGPFAPAVSVGILVHLVEIPVPASGFTVSVSRPGDASRWVLAVTYPGGNYANGSVDVRVVTLGGATLVPATALGSLARSPYNATLAYVPSGTSGRVSGTDQILVSASAYGPDDLLQIIARQSTGAVLLYALSLG